MGFTRERDQWLCTVLSLATATGYRGRSTAPSSGAAAAALCGQFSAEQCVECELSQSTVPSAVFSSAVCGRRPQPHESRHEFVFPLVLRNFYARFPLEYHRVFAKSTCIPNHFDRFRTATRCPATSRVSAGPPRRSTYMTSWGVPSTTLTTALGARVARALGACKHLQDFDS